MQSRRASIGLAVVALAVAVVLFLVLKDNGSESDSTTTDTTAQGGNNQGRSNSPEPSVPTIVVRDAKPVGGAQDLSFKKGDSIRFRVESDVTDEVHLHGYDIPKPVKAGGSVEFNVPATLEGVFEVELEERVVPLAEVTVSP
jgi:hypothetical protein